MDTNYTPIINTQGGGSSYSSLQPITWLVRHYDIASVGARIGTLATNGGKVSRDLSDMSSRGCEGTEKQRTVNVIMRHWKILYRTSNATTPCD